MPECEERKPQRPQSQRTGVNRGEQISWFTASPGASLVANRGSQTTQRVNGPVAEASAYDVKFLSFSHCLQLSKITNFKTFLNKSRSEINL